MTTSIWQSNSFPHLPQKVDVVIVGAGITGLSVAYWLKELKSELKIAIVEGIDLAAGASGRNAGFVTAGSATYLAGLIRRDGKNSALAYWEEKQRNIQLMKERLISNCPGIEDKVFGSVTLYRNETTLELDRELLAELPTIEFVDSQALQKKGLSPFVGGLRLASDGSVHPVKLLESLRTRLQSIGVQFIMGNALSWIQDDRVILERGEIQTEKIFLCVNGYAGQVVPSLNDLVVPKRAQIIAFEAPEFIGKENFYDPEKRVYFRRHLNGPLLVGGLRLLDEKAENSDFDKVSQIIQNSLEKYTQELLGSKLEVKARWSGIMGFTIDEKPLIQTIPGTRNAIFLGGYSGHGMGMAFGLAHKAVKQFLD